MKRAIIDTSSAILLYKVRLFERLKDTYNVIIAVSVYHELSVDGHAGAERFQRWYQEEAFQVLEPDPLSPLRSADLRNRLPTGAGEKDTLTLFLQGAGDFVIVDDRAAALTCRKLGIPYINALLVPKVLFMAGRCSQDTLRRATEGLISIGWYSKRVLRTAERLSDTSMQGFLP